MRREEETSKTPSSGIVAISLASFLRVLDEKSPRCEWCGRVHRARVPCPSFRSIEEA